MRYVTIRIRVGDELDITQPQGLRRAMIWARNPEVVSEISVPEELAPLPPIHGHDPTEGVEVLVMEEPILDPPSNAAPGRPAKHSRRPDKPRGPR